MLKQERKKDWCFREVEKIVQWQQSRMRDKHTQKLSFNNIHFGAGFGPSGFPHVGTLCEIIRTSFVRQVVKDQLDLKTRLFIVSDDLDALRRIPGAFPNQKMLAEHMGIPLCRVLDPFEHATSFSEGINQGIVRLLDEFGVDYEFVRNSEAYMRGEYNDIILNFIRHYAIINNIIAHSVGPIRRQSYSILMPISPYTGRVIEHIRMREVNLNNGTITYEIPADIIIQRPNVRHGITPEEYYPGEPLNEPVTLSALDGQCKLQWKADWCMRLLCRDIAYEMYGEDLSHSAQAVQNVCQALDQIPPVLCKYGLFTDEYGQKISKSKGNGFSLNQLNDYLTREGFKLFLYRRPWRTRRFAPSMAPLINDAVSIETARVRSSKDTGFAKVKLYRIGVAENTTTPIRFGKLLRIISACSPVDVKAAIAYLNTYSIKLCQSEEALLAKAWHYYQNVLLKQRTHLPFAPEERHALLSLVDYLEGWATINSSEIYKILEICRRDHLPEYNKHQFYQLVYRALTGVSSGPKLSTWFHITGIQRSVALLRSMLFAIEASSSALRGQLENPVNPFSHNTEQHDARDDKGGTSVFFKQGDLTNLQSIVFEEIEAPAHAFADHLIENSEDIADSLSNYECYNVALDEIQRSVAFLKNIWRNQEYFKRRIKGITTFLPLNQPLYATCMFRRCAILHGARCLPEATYNNAPSLSEIA